MRGFSFVELLIVVLIIGIMAAGGYPRMTLFTRDVRLEQETKILFNDLCLLRDATIAAGTGTGTVNFYASGTSLIGYTLRDPFGKYVRETFLDATMSREIGAHNACISPFNTAFDALQASTTPGVYCLFFDSNGSATTNFQLSVHSYDPGSALIDDAIGSWIIGISASSTRLYVRNDSAQ